jgi:hypothetical protein
MVPRRSHTGGAILSIFGGHSSSDDETVIEDDETDVDVPSCDPSTLRVSLRHALRHAHAVDRVFAPEEVTPHETSVTVSGTNITVFAPLSRDGSEAAATASTAPPRDRMDIVDENVSRMTLLPSHMTPTTCFVLHTGAHILPPPLPTPPPRPDSPVDIAGVVDDAGADSSASSPPPSPRLSPASSMEYEPEAPPPLAGPEPCTPLLLLLLSVVLLWTGAVMLVLGCVLLATGDAWWGTSLCVALFGACVVCTSAIAVAAGSRRRLARCCVALSLSVALLVAWVAVVEGARMPDAALCHTVVAIAVAALLLLLLPAAVTLRCLRVSRSVAARREHWRLQQRLQQWDAEDAAADASWRDGCGAVSGGAALLASVGAGAAARRWLASRTGCTAAEARVVVAAHVQALWRRFLARRMVRRHAQLQWWRHDGRRDAHAAVTVAYALLVLFAGAVLTIAMIFGESLVLCCGFSLHYCCYRHRHRYRLIDIAVLLFLVLL